MQGISAVIITLNEARNIGRCLDSLQGIADEVLVLDSGSTDGTQEIAASKGAKVVELEWKGYSATKNHGNDLACHDYVLSLDADEALSEDLKVAILKVKGRMQGGYSFNRLAFYCGKAIKRGGWYPDTKMRLFPKGKARWEGAYVHEELILEGGLPITQLSGDLFHFTYYTVAEHKERARKYASLAADKLKGKGKLKLLVKAIFSPQWRFLQMFLLKAGFLDGWRGWRIATITAGEVWRKYWWAMRK